MLFARHLIRLYLQHRPVLRKSLGLGLGLEFYLSKVFNFVLPIVTRSHSDRANSHQGRKQTRIRARMFLVIKMFVYQNVSADQIVCVPAVMGAYLCPLHIGSPEVALGQV